jgi:hypothetical protein
LDNNAKELLERGTRLFGAKRQLDELHQRIAEECFPARAEFTRDRVVGTEIHDGLYESTPARNHDELSSAFGAVLRPRNKWWFKGRAREQSRRTDAAKRWFEWADGEMRTLIYAARANFQRTMQERDPDVTAFGNGVTSLTENPDRNGLFFEWHHLRDCAWEQNRYYEVDVLHRKFKKPVRVVARMFGESALTSSQKTLLEKNPYEEIELRHVCMPREDYDPSRKSKGLKKQHPYVSVYLNPDNAEVIRESGYYEFPYKVSKWRNRGNSAYAYSPAAMLGLVEARLLQQQARVVLEAGELRVNPPLIARRDGVLGRVQNYPGSVNWVDYEYDEKMGEALRAMDLGGDVGIGLEMKQDTRELLHAIWYLNRLTLPSDKDMTAYEVSERISEYIRSIGPVLEPFETDNAVILDAAFAMAMRLGLLGSIADIPQELRGADTEYEFDTPIQQAIARQRVAQAKESLEFIGLVAKVTPDAMIEVDTHKLVREGLEGIAGGPGWLRKEEDVAAEMAARAQKEEEAAAQAAAMQQMNAVGDLAHKGADLVPKLAGAAQTVAPMLQQMGAGGDEGYPEVDPDLLDDGAGGAAAGLPPELARMLSGGEQGSGPVMRLPPPIEEDEPALELDEILPPQRQGGRRGRQAPMVDDDTAEAAGIQRIESALEKLMTVMSADQEIIYKDGRPAGSRRVLPKPQPQQD